ncbi:MAG: beta-lactamase family protein [Bacteroidales bacterium]|nr:beta-lactamase family protein [Bacteroidales bacterium]
MTKSGIRLVLTTVAAVAVSVVVFALNHNGSDNGSGDARIPIDLNKNLTNELSDTTDLEGLDRKVRNYMAQWNMKGASLAIMRNDSLLYAKGYGIADKDEPMTPGHIMRVASVSKLITATGIMILQERSMLSLSDTVFGPSGILNDEEFTAAIKDRNYYKITVEDLLRHKGGFTGRAGDPMFSTRTIMLQNRLKEAPDHDTLVKIILKRRLGFVPGTSQYYSNFGYLLLSMIIEKVSGESYEDFIQENVLLPAGCTDMHIANIYYKDRYRNEVRYFLQSNDAKVQEYNNSGRMVERCYGGNDIHNLSGAGAWVTSVPELARFVASIDGRPEVPDIISPESVMAMTEWFDENTYSLGWNDTKPTGEWTRTGTLSGTSALIKVYPDGECWIMVTNTSTWKGPGQTRYTAGLFRTLRQSYSDKLPKRDFFYSTSRNGRRP